MELKGFSYVKEPKVSQFSFFEVEFLSSTNFFETTSTKNKGLLKRTCNVLHHFHQAWFDDKKLYSLSTTQDENK